MSDEASALSGFMGKVRLFPLPNVVLFPQVIQPLHIFEPRYRELAADALAGDHLIAMALLAPGWEKDYAGAPAIHPVACLGKIIADQQQNDGRYNVLLQGLSRIEIGPEIPHCKLYRLARADLLVDVEIEDETAARRLRKQLSAAMPRWFRKKKGMSEQIRKLFRSELSLGALCDIFSFALANDVEVKQALLEELDVEKRVQRLLDYLQSCPPVECPDQAGRTFPPEFSPN